MVQVRLTPLCGALSEAPLCYLLEIDSFCLLLDCGCSEQFDEEQLAEVKKVTPRVDVVLLSHPDLAHVGALPHLIGRCGMNPTVYSTAPVRRLGEVTVIDYYKAKQASSDFTAYDLNDVEAAFSLSRWITLSFQQEAALEGRGSGISISPLLAGRCLGGTVWRIRVHGEDVVYAVDYNHRKERLLSETMFHEMISRPALLIADAWCALTPQLDRKARDDGLIGAMMATLEAGGSCLVPVDPAGRVLELACALDDHWAQHKLVASLVLLSDTAARLVQYAQTMLEFCTPGVATTFAMKRTSPFNFQRLRVASSLEELGHLPPGPKVILATSPSLEAGYARQLLVDMAADERNAIIFVERAEAGTLADTLQRWDPSASTTTSSTTTKQSAASDSLPALPSPSCPYPTPLELELSLSHRIPLEGEELAAWQAEQAAKEEAAWQVEEGSGQQGPEASGGSTGVGPGLDSSMSLPLRSSSGSISRLVRDAATGLVVQRLGDTERDKLAGSAGAAEPGRHTHQGGAGGPGKAAAGVQLPAAQSSVPVDAVLLDGFKPPEGSVAPMFPDEDDWLMEEWDDYGAVVRREDFTVMPEAGLGGAGARAGSGAQGGDGSLMDVDGVADGSADVVEEVPTKLVTRNTKLVLRAALRFFDYEGRADGRAVKEYLARVAPRRVVLVHGREAATRELKASLEGELAYLEARVYAPGVGEAIDVSLSTHSALQVSEELEHQLRYTATGTYKVAWLEGRVAAPEPFHPNQKLLVPLHGSLGPAVDATTTSFSSGGGGGQVFLTPASQGIPLSRIKAALAEAGIPAQFVAKGVLAVCDGVLTVSLAPGGNDKHVMLDGALCADYYRVRQFIYEQFGVCC